ncbi:MAG: (Fe-S)-binding protein [Chloroflexi bacterium CG07_land_8_20_14_0_80_51_10]|nr:MAG: (Fe-S)-binding protein [Chloroflexi bacterium CG07_land_8_20_14_0_80_51_10]
MSVLRRVVLHFPRSLVDQPIMCRLAREFNIDFNILKASVTPKEEGLLVVELSGIEKDYDKGMKYLAETGVEIQPLSQDVVRNETRCTHCGACVVLCPTGALAIDPATRKVDFDDTKCIACGICVLPCPPRAMEIHF